MATLAILNCSEGGAIIAVRCACKAEIRVWVGAGPALTSSCDGCGRRYEIRALQATVVAREIAGRGMVRKGGVGHNPPAVGMGPTRLIGGGR